MKDSTATFNKAVTSSSGITLDDNTGSAKVIFAANNSVDYHWYHRWGFKLMKELFK